MCTCLYVFVYTCTYTFIHMYVHIYSYTCLYMFIYICVHTRLYIFVYTCTYTHTDVSNECQCFNTKGLAFSRRFPNRPSVMKDRPWGALAWKKFNFALVLVLAKLLAYLIYTNHDHNFSCQTKHSGSSSHKLLSKCLLLPVTVVILYHFETYIEWYR